MRKFLTIVLLTVSLSLLVTACGSNAPAAPSTSIKVTIGDFYFSPHTFTVPVGQLISITAVNNGGHVHTLSIMQKGITVEHWSDATDKPNIYWAMGAIAAVGGTKTSSFTAPSEPGDYQIVCENAGHIEAGMVAKLIVVAP